MEDFFPKIQVIPGKLRFSPPVLLEHPISNHLQGQILFNHDLQKKNTFCVFRRDFQQSSCFGLDLIVAEGILL